VEKKIFPSAGNGDFSEQREGEKGVSPLKNANERKLPYFCPLKIAR
jgi:hypothetical protein